MRIKELREARGLTQVQLADGVGVTQGAVAKWETGRAIPGGGKLPALADMLNCSINDLFEPKPTQALPPGEAAS